MKIVAVAACTSGIAHTYIAKEKLIRAAESLGHTIHVETQGTIGTCLLYTSFVAGTA